MMKSSQIRTVLVCVKLIVIGFAPVSWVEGALPEGMAETLELRIDSELDKVLQELITEKQVCEELWLTWPLEPPAKDIADVENDIQGLIKKKAEIKFPTAIQEDFEKEAVARYTLFKIGQRVSFDLRDGSQVSGYLRDHGETEVLIDNRRIELSAVDDDDLAHFDEMVRELRIKEYIRARLAELKEERSNFEQRIKEEVSRQLYMDFGYIQIDGRWVAKKAYVNERLSSQREKLREHLKPMLRIKLYYDNGFVLFQDEWMTKGEAERRKQEQLEKERKEAEAAAKKAESGEADNDGKGDGDDEPSLWD